MHEHDPLLDAIAGGLGIVFVLAVAAIAGALIDAIGGWP